MAEAELDGSLGYRDVSDKYERFFERRETSGYTVPVSEIYHDTSEENCTFILMDARLKACRADSKKYDGLLAEEGAPKVVFFSATKFWDSKTEGWNLPREAEYPRDLEKGKPAKRFLLKPTLLGLHAPEVYKVFFIDANKPHPKSRSLQVHVLFVRCQDEDILTWCKRRGLVQLDFVDGNCKLIRTTNKVGVAFEHIWMHKESYVDLDDVYVWLNVAVAHDIDISNNDLYSVRDITRSQRKR